jgi:hypothetical protein
VDGWADRRRFAVRALAGSAVAVLGLPVAVYGALHRALPALAVRRMVRRFTVPGARKAQTPLVVLLAGVVVFGLVYGVYAALVHVVWGWPVSFWYALSLPAAGLWAHAYAERLRWLPAGWRGFVLRWRAPFVLRGLVRQRGALVAEIEDGRRAYRARAARGGERRNLD